MIGKALLAKYARFLHLVSQTRRDDLVIDTPTYILVPGLAPVRPPGILLLALINDAKCIDEADSIEKIAQPGAFLGQKSGILLVRSPVFQVNILMRNIPVTTYNELPAFTPQRLQVQQETIHKAPLGFLAMVSRRSGRRIQ